MITITGKKFTTSFGVFVVHNEQTEPIRRGDTVVYEREEYTVLEIVPPTKPEDKWSVRIG